MLSIYLLSFHINHSSLLNSSTHLPPSSPIPNIEFHLFIIDILLKIHKPDMVLLFDDYNMPDVLWTFNNLGLFASRDLTPTSALVVDFFSYLNFFQLNNFVNFSGNILDLVVSSSSEPSDARATSSLNKPHDIFLYLSNIIVLNHLNFISHALISILKLVTTLQSLTSSTLTNL